MIKVLVVDDSLFMRRLVSDLLTSDPEITVSGTAKDGLEAIQKISVLRPDVVTLDLVMPELDGLETLQKIMAEYPTPIILLSAYSTEGAEITLDGLHAGAVGFVPKPSGELSLDIAKIKDQLLMEVKAAAMAHVYKIDIEKSRRRRRRSKAIKPGAVRAPLPKGIVVIGASTGGPQTLEIILQNLPKDFSIPIVIAQHMPARIFTHSLAEHLNRESALAVKEATSDERMENGKIYLIPGGCHTTISRKIHLVESNSSSAELDVSPSIDGAMKSAADFYNERTVGVLLTGMGKDGVEGMRTIKEKGGKTIAQDKSALIFGMPKLAIDQGLADQILPATEIGQALAEIIQ